MNIQRVNVYQNQSQNQNQQAFKGKCDWKIRLLIRNQVKKGRAVLTPQMVDNYNKFKNNGENFKLSLPFFGSDAFTIKLSHPRYKKPATFDYEYNLVEDLFKIFLSKNNEELHTMLKDVELKNKQGEALGETKNQLLDKMGL